jgi:ubiquinone/menaquinone biosynthesis C-methylase UbiE
MADDMKQTNISKYGSFARVYDTMMDNIPYTDWVKYIYEIMIKYECNPELVLDLGCGTGNISGILANKYDVIGIDISEDMLMIAKEKAKKADLDILYLQQDMTEFELYGTVGCIVSICDSINYITEEEDLLQVFKLVNNYLDPKGLFIFDLNTEYKFKNILGDNIFAKTYDNSAYIWENYYYEEEKINEYLLTLFIKEDNNYERYEETHYEKCYSIELIKKLLEIAGLKLEGVFEALTFDSTSNESERIYFVAREQQKELKK